MPVLPHAHPFKAEAGPIGVLLLHGFTGSPSSMRPWAEHLHADGLVLDRLARLAATRALAGAEAVAREARRADVQLRLQALPIGTAVELAHRTSSWLSTPRRPPRSTSASISARRALLRVPSSWRS